MLCDMENLIYHYTDLNATINIIGRESLTFWGSRYDCMNDSLDYQYARNRLLPSMMKAAEEVFKGHSTSLILDEIQTLPYIVSFSKKKDDFLMWRMYNAKVSLILDIGYFSKSTPNSALIECEYVSDDYQEIRDSFFKIDKQINCCSNISVH